MYDPKIIPVFRAQLPSRKELEPYLAEIDANRWYSNFGPLLGRLESRLAELFQVPDACIATTANGTTALTAALLASGVQRGARCAMPSWTFAATPSASLAAGMAPYFVDVDENTWAIEPDDIRPLVSPENIGAVIPVSPFGAPIDRAAWDRFSTETGVPVVIDAAAGFDTVARVPEMGIGATPIMLSMHATKPFAVGEGGVLLCNDEALIGKVRQIANFGFGSDREAEIVGINAKLNEYAAAIGLAALETWEHQRVRWATMTDRYRTQLSEIPEFSLTPRFGSGWVSSYCNVTLPEGADIESVIDRLREFGIETRRWWGRGCHAQKAFIACPHTSLDMTESLAARVLGLPFWIGLPASEIDRVVAALARSLSH